MDKYRKFTATFAAFLTLVGFQNGASVPIASDSKGTGLNKLIDTSAHINIIYDTDSFKEIHSGVLQFVGNVSKVSLSCRLARDKDVFLSWKYHGIEERNVRRQKSLEDKNGIDLDLSSGPPVVRMECFWRRNKTISTNTLIYTGENQSPYLFKNGKTLRATFLNLHTVHLPCLLKYPLDHNGDGKKLQLFKDGKLVENDALSYIPELGYQVNLTELENPLGTYECRVTNGLINDVVFVELDYVPVSNFHNVSSATIATTSDVNTVTKALNNATTNPIALEEAPRVEFNYSGQPFKEIEPAVLQYVSNDLEMVSISCHLTSDKSAMRWKYHGIEEWKVKILKSLDVENGIDLDLSSGPPVIRMQCYKRITRTETLSNSTLIYIGYDTSPYLYRRGDTIRAIALNQSTVHLPCILNYPLDKNIDGKKLQLFKDGKLVGNDAFSYIPELGYHLNLKGLENPLGTYECRVSNSANDVVFMELDNGTFIDVKYKGHLDKFYAGAPFLQPFECKLPKDMYEYDFEWYYLLEDGRYTPLNVTDVTNSSDASSYMQKVKITFPETNIVGVVCASTIKDSESSYNNSCQGFVDQPYPPRILNQKDDKPIIYVSGMNLTCVTSTDPVTFHWLKNGRELSNGEHIIENHAHLPYRSSIILNPTADDKDANYTCIVSNFLGNATHDYRVQLNTTQQVVPNSTTTSAATLTSKDDEYITSVNHCKPYSLSSSQPDQTVLRNMRSNTCLKFVRGRLIIKQTRKHFKNNF